MSVSCPETVFFSPKWQDSGCGFFKVLTFQEHKLLTCQELLGTMGPGTKGPWDHGTMGPWDQGPGDHGTMGPWDHGTIEKGAILFPPTVAAGLGKSMQEGGDEAKPQSKPN